ncbi:hypothetical protein NQ314_003687 [Rhamnusium bicolor]|uniref:TIR domain-containing protein n=1 Tax=Rhamnusium bicolor TaxID=1586634 RepID=A0AAV8ZLM4_9CUCU|nr:hypothetical protein NQ314_003687 [Rhamnusium bicolor]
MAKPKINPIENGEPAPIFLGRDASSGCLCREYPDIYVVCFGRNLCQRMPMGINITTPILKITSTHIFELKPGDFDSTPQLEALKIDGNYNLSKIFPGTFNADLIKLTNLSISFNPKLKTLDPYSFEGLINLRILFLIKNGFSNVYDVTPSLSPLILPKLFKLSLNENNFINIFSSDFRPMENSSLEELNLVLCRLEEMDPDCFAPLKKLEVLRLGENSFNTTTITEVIATSIKLGIPLKLLNLYAVGFRKSPPKKLMEAIAKSNISNLNLSKNQFEVIRSDSFPYMPNLHVLDLREVLALEINNDAFSNLPNLKTLMLSGNKLPTIPEGVLLGNLTYLDLQQNSNNLFYSSYFSIANGKFSNMKQLSYLNLNFNRLNHLLNTSFVGLTNLRILGLKNGTIYHIQNDTFAPMSNLVFLNLENNHFVKNSPFGIEGDIFKGLGHLQVLLLGGCGISYLSKYGNPFVHLKSLAHLGLERNQLTTLSPTDFSCLLSGAMLDDFSNLTELELQENPFSCDCQSYVIFDAWMHIKNNVMNNFQLEVHCAFPEAMSNYSLVDYFKNVHNGTMFCDTHKSSPRLVVILPLVLLLLFFVSLAIFVYYYRWHIRYWIFLTRLYLSRKGKIKPRTEEKGYTNYAYDAFVSYSNEDRNFVVRLVSMLENYEPFLKLCVYERDFEIGTIISESVLESVAKSRKTLLVISDHYAKSQWCRWESQIAEHHRLFFENENGEYVDDALVLIKLGPVNESHLTPTLKYLLKTRIYLQWEVDEKKQKVFWHKLRYTLATPKHEQIVLENTRM